MEPSSTSALLTGFFYAALCFETNPFVLCINNSLLFIVGSTLPSSENNSFIALHF